MADQPKNGELTAEQQAQLAAHEAYMQRVAQVWAGFLASLMQKGVPPEVIATQAMVTAASISLANGGTREQFLEVAGRYYDTAKAEEAEPVPEPSRIVIAGR